MLNYRLSVANETYPVEDMHFLRESTLVQDPVGNPFSFVSPVRLMTGQHCVLWGDDGGYQLLINACMGFTYTPRYFISGIIVTRETALVRSA